jgi:transposase
MEHYAGLDVSLETTSLCVVDEAGAIVCERKIVSEPEAIARALRETGGSLKRVGLEAGPLSQWLYEGLRAGLAGALCRPPSHEGVAIGDAEQD